ADAGRACSRCGCDGRAAMSNIEREQESNAADDGNGDSAERPSVVVEPWTPRWDRDTARVLGLVSTLFVIACCLPALRFPGRGGWDLGPQGDVRGLELVLFSWLVLPGWANVLLVLGCTSVLYGRFRGAIWFGGGATALSLLVWLGASIERSRDLVGSEIKQ